MKFYPYIFFAAATVMGTPLSSFADCPNGAVHIHLSDGETVDDCTLDEPIICDDNIRPWYMHEHFDYYGAWNDPSYEVEAEASWPSQREEFSDYLFR